MVTKSGIIFLLFVGALYTTEAAIDGWTNPPSTDGTATPSIPENIAVGTTGVTITATRDSAGTITYEIVSQTTTGKLSISTTTGLLSLDVGTFDFEADPTYVLTVKATDSAGGADGTATVTLNIEDVNEAPVFSSSPYTATVPDASTGGTSVTTITASDVDAGDTITYSITGGNTDTDFDIDGTTGAITVATGKTLDAGTLKAYTLTVTATDSDGLSATATVSITVQASGGGVDKPDPVFSPASYSPCIADKSPADTTLTTVTAAVPDTSETITYAVASGNTDDHFKIGTSSGLIQVNDAKTLNKTATASYVLVVTASVAPDRTGTTTVSVTVADSCDSGTAVAVVSMVMLFVTFVVTLI